jgi:hypothetical protein
VFDGMGIRREVALAQGERWSLTVKVREPGSREAGLSLKNATQSGCLRAAHQGRQDRASGAYLIEQP